MLKNLALLAVVIGFVAAATNGLNRDPNNKGLLGQVCRPRNGNYKCTEDGAWPDETFCHFYYDCWNGTSTDCECTDGYLFDLNYMGCNFPEQVDCGERIIPGEGTGPTPPPRETTTRGPVPTRPVGDDCRADQQGDLFPNPEDCATYFICDAGHLILEPCPPGLVYNPRYGYCDYIENVPECNGVTNKPPPTDKPTENPGTDNPGTDNPGTDNPGTENPTTENSGTERPTDTTDDARTTYVPTELPPFTTTPNPGIICDENDNGRLHPDPFDCHYFYACVGGMPIQLDCPDGLAFNPVLEACDRECTIPACNVPPCLD